MSPGPGQPAAMALKTGISTSTGAYRSRRAPRLRKKRPKTQLKQRETRTVRPFSNLHHVTRLVFAYFIPGCVATSLPQCSPLVRSSPAKRLPCFCGPQEDEETVKQLEALLDYLKNLRRGAFAHFSQQPLVHALLTLVGSYSGIALLEYFRMSGL